MASGVRRSKSQIVGFSSPSATTPHPPKAGQSHMGKLPLFRRSLRQAQEQRGVRRDAAFHLFSAGPLPMSSQFPLGAAVSEAGIRFSVWSGSASRLWVSLFDGAGDQETARLELPHVGDGVYSLAVQGLKPGVRYGFRAEGEYN